MAVQIQFRRGTAAEWSTSTANPILAVAEMGLETDTRKFKIGDGYQHWNDLPYGGIEGPQGPTGSTGTVGYTAVANVLYVSKSGNDANDGTSLTFSKLTIESALTVATTGTTIFVKSGDYTENTPLVVPDFVSIIGDNLRSVNVRPNTVTNDIFYVNNGVYIAHMTFKDHQYPAAAISFPTDGSAGVISTSPYVQNCTSMTSDGTGMRVDGSLALGTKSMVVDAFTQYNQGGIGIHMLNRGYTQLVSVFTICCDKGILCESGGFCSITNSNSSFGNYALYADGVSETLYTGNTVGDTSGRTFVIDNLTTKPSIGDAISFGDGNYYTVASSTAFKTGSTTIAYPILSSATVPDASLRNARQSILNEKSKLQVLTINHVLETFPGFDFNQFKCSRDVGNILEAVCYDMVLNTNYQSVKAGTSYYRAVSSIVTSTQLTQTLSAITSLKANTLAILSAGTAYTRVGNLFDVILDIFENGLAVAPALDYSHPPADCALLTIISVDELQANKNFIAEETVAYVSNFTYNTSTCYRDTGLIVDSVAFDLLYNGTSQSVFAGLQYWSQIGYVSSVVNALTTTTDAINYVGTQLNGILASAGVTLADVFYSVSDNVTTIIDILNSGNTVGVTDLIVPNTTATTVADYVTGYNVILANKSVVQNDTINYITTTYPDFVYNTTTWYRDVGYIIDGLATDLLHGGNRQSVMSAVYYYGYNTSTTATVIANEIPQTTAAYNFIKTISADIVKGIAITGTYQTSVSQTVTTSTATNIQIRDINKKIFTITNIINNGPSVAPPPTSIGVNASTDQGVIDAFNLLLANREFIQAETVAFINTSYVGLVYSTATCKRDVGYIIDAVSYDLLYGGNSQTADAADAYYDGNILRISSTEKLATIAAYDFIKTIVDDCILANPVTPQQIAVSQDFTNGDGGVGDSIRAQELIDIVANLVENSYSSTVSLTQTVGTIWTDNSPVTFHQYSQIQSSAHNFEWIGAGTNINAALPYLGGEPITENQAVAVNNGKVYYTGTDQQGDFRIGNDLVINNSIGTITGRTFTKSLFAVMTPYILAIGT
jgi:hypothetical protein